MKRHVRRIVIFLCLLTLVNTVPQAAWGGPERKRELSATGKSLMGLQEGAYSVVSGFFGIGKHGIKFLYHGTRDGLHGLGKKASKADKKLQKRLW